MHVYIPLLVGEVPLLVGEVPLLVGEVPLLVGDVPFTRPHTEEMNEAPMECQSHNNKIVQFFLV